jgi:tungstate transport system substrate-binding protein
MTRTSWLSAFCLLAVASPARAAAPAPRPVIMATTTSTQDTGLLDALVPILERERNLKVKVVAVGSGEALAMGRRGDADVLLVHSPKDEEKFMADGVGSLRLAVMHNDFVLVGSAADPARAKGLLVLDALQKIAAAKAPWASRGDKSGTHKRELELWQKAKLGEPAWPGAVSTGQGMGETVRIASEKGAYTLIDRGTYLAVKSTLAVVIIAEGGADLLNPYSVIVVNPDKVPKVHAKEAREVADWLVLPATQKLIGEFGKAKLGQALFVPDAR